MVNALGATNGFEYNVFGNLTKLIDAKGNQTTFEYDLNGRLTQKTYADNASWNYQYDAVGNLVKRTDAKEQITAYAYDLLSRLATNSYYPSSSSYPSSPSKTVSFSYDAFGRMTAWNDGSYSGTFSYDDTNRTRTVTVNYGLFSKSYSYHYDLAGRKTKFIGPDSVEIGYTYNAEGRLSAINIPGEGTISYNMNQHGQLSGQTLPGGNSRYYGYDAMMSLVTNVALDSAQNPLMIRAYSRQLAGNIVNQQTESGSISYSYDAIDQLIGVTNVALGNEWYSYDAMGNRLASSNTILGTTNVSSYSINALNQYAQISNFEFQVSLQYDQNGNRTNKVTATETNAYTWDIENRLVGFQKQEGTNLTSAQYNYDVFGRRLSKAVNGITNYFLYTDEGLIGEYDAAGNETKSYGYVPNSLWGNNPAWMRRDGQYYYFVNDHLGAPQKLVAKNGAIVWSLVQDAFGNAVVSSNSTVICNLRFSSQYYDAESGLHYNTGRYFEPISGRYLSKDTAGEEYNGYTGLNNDPNNFIDPLGDTAKKVTAGIQPPIPPLPGLPDTTLPLEPGECRIILACHNITVGDVSFPVYHCYLIFEDGSGNRRACRGGPTRGNRGRAQPNKNCKCCGIFGQIVNECGAYDNQFVDYEKPGNVKQVLAQGRQICDMWKCVENMMAMNHNSCFVYNPVNHNSNTTISDALFSCGFPKNRLRPPNGVRAPGLGESLKSEKQCFGKD